MMTPAEFQELKRLMRRVALKDQFARAGCAGKQQFASWRDARRAIHVGKLAQPYKCGFCGAWHVATIDRQRRLSSRVNTRKEIT